MKNKKQKLLALLLTLATGFATFAPAMVFAAGETGTTPTPEVLWRVDFGDNNDANMWTGEGNKSDLGNDGAKQHNGFRLMNAWDDSATKPSDGIDYVKSKSYIEDGVLNARWNGVNYSGNAYTRAFLDVYLPEDLTFRKNQLIRYEKSETDAKTLSFV